MDSSHKAVLLKELKNEINQSTDVRYVHRLHCVLLVYEGCSCSELAKWFGVSVRTIERWIQQYKDFGLEGLRDDKRTGRLPKLNFDQMKALALTITKMPVEFGYVQPEWSPCLLAEHIMRTYSITLSVRQCRRLLHQLRNVID